MPLKMIWADQSQLEKVAETRARCYAPAAKDLERFRENISNDPRGKAGDYLLAQSSDGRSPRSGAHPGQKRRFLRPATESLPDEVDVFCAVGRKP